MTFIALAVHDVFCRAKYRDGKPIASCPKSASDPAPCAGKDGTLIVVNNSMLNGERDVNSI